MSAWCTESHETDSGENCRSWKTRRPSFLARQKTAACLGGLCGLSPVRSGQGGQMGFLGTKIWRFFLQPCFFKNLFLVNLVFLVFFCQNLVFLVDSYAKKWKFVFKNGNFAKRFSGVRKNLTTLVRPKYSGGCLCASVRVCVCVVYLWQKILPRLFGHRIWMCLPWKLRRFPKAGS